MKRAAPFCTATLLLFACERTEPTAKTSEEPTAAAKPDAKPEEADAKPTAASSKPNPTPPPADPDALAKARKLYLARLNEGRRLTKAGQHSEAIATYLQALEVDPSDVALLGELGWASFKGGDLPGARHATTHGLRFARTDEQRGMLTYNLGRVAEAEGDPTRAAELYRESLTLRDNATVRKRLEALHAPPPAPPPPRGMEVLAEGLPSLEAVCAAIIAAQCEEWKVFVGDECGCDATGFSAASPEGWAGTLVMNAGIAEEVWFPVIETSKGWAVMGHLVDSYNPGAFGVYGETSIVANEIVPDLLGPGQPGWHVSFRKDRVDRDMGVNEIEDEYWVGHTFCVRQGDRAHCTQPVISDHGYSREVEFPDQDEPGTTHDGLPTASRYSDELTWADGTLTVTPGERKGMTEVDEGGTPGRSLPAGKHALRDLMGL